MKNGLTIALGILSILGIGIAIGAVIVFLLISAGGKPTNVSIGPVGIEIPTNQPLASSVPSQIPSSNSQSGGGQCSHFQAASSTQTMVTVPSGMWEVTRKCSPAQSACFYTMEQSSGGQYLSYEHQGNSDRYWVNAFCTEAEAKNFANTDAKAMLEWWQYTQQNPLP